MYTPWVRQRTPREGLTLLKLSLHSPSVHDEERCPDPNEGLDDRTRALVMSVLRDPAKIPYRGGSQSAALGVYQRVAYLRQAALQLGAELCQLVSVGQVEIHLIGRR